MPHPTPTHKRDKAILNLTGAAMNPTEESQRENVRAARERLKEEKQQLHDDVDERFSFDTTDMRGRERDVPQHDSLQNIREKYQGVARTIIDSVPNGGGLAAALNSLEASFRATVDAALQAPVVDDGIDVDDGDDVDEETDSNKRTTRRDKDDGTKRDS